MAKKASKGKKVQGRKPKEKKSAPSKVAKAKKGTKPAKVFIYALALAALGGGGYLVFDRVRKRKMMEENQNPSMPDSDTIIINNTLPTSYASVASRTLSSASDQFPLKRGSKGARVRMLQQALVKTSPGISIDGQFGLQTAAALKSGGYPEVVEEALFNKITGTSGSLTVVFNPATLAASLYTSAQAKNLQGVISTLKQLKTVSDYSSVNEYYKKQSFIAKTIVTDLLDYSFKSNETAKAQIKNEFLRMGLKLSATGSWSLQGLRLYKDLITIRDTVVIDGKNNRIPVRRNTILGDEMEVASGMTWFKSIDNSILKVPTQDVKYT
jgi:hypothetical protein